MKIKAGDQYFNEVWSDRVESSRIRSYESPEQRRKYNNISLYNPWSKLVEIHEKNKKIAKPNDECLQECIEVVENTI